MAQREEVKYKGLTKIKYKRLYGSSTPGSTKAGNCQATGLDKAMAKYPRSHKTNPVEYIGHNIKKHKEGKWNNNSFFSLLNK